MVQLYDPNGQVSMMLGRKRLHKKDILELTWKMVEIPTGGTAYVDEAVYFDRVGGYYLDFNWLLSGDTATADTTNLLTRFGDKLQRFGEDIERDFA